MQSSATRRNFLKIAGLGALGGVFPRNGAAARNENRKPDIVLIMADDMGYSDIGCYGGEIDTPSIDRLAGEGLRFTQFYNCARCCPTRASLLTGLYPHQAGIGHMVDDRGFDSYRGDLNGRCVTIAEALKPVGYRTYLSGKWHVTKNIGYWSGEEQYNSTANWPRQRGFDRFFGTITGCGSYYDPITLVRENDPIMPEDAGFFYTDAIADTTASYIGEHAATTPDDPFFMYVAFTAPHWPLHALPEDIAKYKGRFDRGWDILREERLARMVEMGIIDPSWRLTSRDPQAPAWENAPDKEWECRRMETYAAQIDRMDQGVGRIIAALESAGRLDNTVILFLADNGGCAENLRPGLDALYVPHRTRDGRQVKPGNRTDILAGPADTYLSYATPWANVSNTPFRLYKHWVHEGGISTPLIARWPARISERGEFRNQPGHLIDLMATCVAVAGTEYPASFNGAPIHPMEGKSLLPAFEGLPLTREAIYWEHEGNKAVRKGDWKLVSRYPGGWELYNLAKDRTELHDLAVDQTEVVAELAALWDAWAARCGVMSWDEVGKAGAPDPVMPVKGE